jgi:hypothetical protein
MVDWCGPELANGLLVGIDLSDPVHRPNYPKKNFEICQKKNFAPKKQFFDFCQKNSASGDCMKNTIACFFHVTPAGLICVGKR